MGKYRNFAELQRKESPKSYSIHQKQGHSDIAVIAPHGGGIEPGTLEIARSIAGEEHSFYGFEGCKSRDNSDLHITSTRFDEPKCLDIVYKHNRVIAIHGCVGAGNSVYTGGLDDKLKTRVSERLIRAGFTVRTDANPELQGSLTTNICNRSATGKGVQLEIEEGLRRKMFAGLSRKQRQKTTAILDIFVTAIQEAIYN